MKIETTDADGNVVHLDLPDDHPVAEALRPGAPHHTREDWTLIREGNPCAEHGDRCRSGES